MSTRFIGEGNIGSDPEVKVFPPSGNEPPRVLMRLNVRFDNPTPTQDGVVDRGGFWANVETWHRDGEHWSTLFQRGMRVMVMGNLVQDQWEQGGEQRTAMKVVANRIGILPYRVGQVTMQPSKGQQQAGQGQSTGEGTSPAYEGQGQHGGM